MCLTTFKYPPERVLKTASSEQKQKGERKRRKKKLRARNSCSQNSGIKRTNIMKKHTENIEKTKREIRKKENIYEAK